MHLFAKIRSFKIYHSALVAWKPGFVALLCFLLYTVRQLHIVFYSSQMLGTKADWVC